MSTINNHDEKLGCVNHWVGSSQDWTEAFLDNLDRFLAVKCVVLIGSSIRRRIHQRSDFDLLVVYDGDSKPSFDAPIEVDIRRYSIADLDRKLLLGDEILCWALKYGIVAYDADGKWAELQSRIGDDIPLPSWKDADERSRKSLARAEAMLENGDEEAADDLVLASLTQFARRVLIEVKVFPASRPELPSQLRQVLPHHPVADLLEKAMFVDVSSDVLVAQTRAILDAKSQAAL